MPITLERAIKLDNAIEKFFKAVGREERIRNRINKLAEENYKKFLPVVEKWMDFTIKEINRAFRKKYITKSYKFQKDKAIDITTKLLDWEKLNEDGKRMLKPAMLDIMAKSGNEAYKIVGFEASFDILNPEAVKAVDKICSKLVTQVNKETKQAINHLIREGIKEGKSMGRVAKEIRPLVGLTERQAKAVRNYEQWLINKRPDISALKRAKWVERYTKKLHKYRTEMIARTESMRATNEGNLIGYKEAGYKTVRWSANVDACPLCDAESGHVYTIEESRGMLPAHPSCRCSWLPEGKVAVPKVPKIPKPVGRMVKAPRRMGHLSSDMTSSEIHSKIIADAKLQGIKITEKEAGKISDAIYDWTGIGEHHYYRLYQTKGKKAVIDLMMEERNLSLYKAKKYADSIAENVNLIEKYLKFAPKYPEVDIYRGLKLTADEIKAFKVGQTIDMRGISSFTSSAEKAREYGDFLVTIKNADGVSITHLSHFPKEREILMSGKLKFKILKVSERGMTIEQVGLPPAKKALFDFSVKTIPESKYTETAAKDIKKLLKLKKVDLTGMNMQNANNLKQVLVRLSDKFENNLSEIVVKRVPGKYGEVFYTSGNKMVMNFSKKIYNNLEYWVRDQIKKGQSSKFFAATTDANASAANFIHEFAHTVVDFNKLPVDSPFRKEIINIIAEYNKDLNMGKAKVFISKYAKEAGEVNEFIAEAFTNAIASENPSPYSMKVLKLMEKYYGRK